MELVARLSCVGFFHTVGLKEVENNINDVTCYTQACAMHTRVCSEISGRKMFISYLFREGVGCQITPRGCPELYP